MLFRMFLLFSWLFPQLADQMFAKYLVSGIQIVTPFSKSIQVKCAEDPEYTVSVVITM